MTTRLHGLVAATHTPFAADGDLNLSAVEAQADHLLRVGVTTAFVGGSTGECHSLTVAERRALAERWAAVANGTPLRVVIHVGANCLADARALAGQAQQLGAAAISALAPNYFKPRTLADLVDWCRAVAAAAPAVPFYFYDIPALTGVHFAMPDLLDAAAGRVPTLAGIKFTNADLMAYQLCLRSQDGRFDIPWGVDEYLLAALALGGRGAVGSSYNFAAPVYHRMIRAFHAGDLATARNEQFQAVRLIQLLSDFGYLAAAKAVMGMLGVPVGDARMPNAQLATAQRDDLRRRLANLGFFDWIGAAKNDEDCS
jgi:N-acetylneuraminate lyase